MKKLLFGFYIISISVGYSVEVEKPLCRPGMRSKPNKEKAIKPIEYAKMLNIPKKEKKCKIIDKIADNENSLTNDILTIKENQASLDKTIKEVGDSSEPTQKQTAKIMYATTSMLRRIGAMMTSPQLHKIKNVISQSDNEDIDDINQLLCEGRNFLHIFCLSFIEDKVDELPVKNEFKEKVQSEWFKNGFTTITKTIQILEKYAEKESCREALMSFFPLVEENYKEISTAIHSILTAPTSSFLHDFSKFVDTVQKFTELLKRIETTTCLTNSTGMTEAEEVVSLSKNLYNYFSDLLNKINKIKTAQEIKTNEDMDHYNSKSDAFIQDMLHDIFLCKYNKVFYKQVNNDINKLLVLIKALEELE